MGKFLARLPRSWSQKPRFWYPGEPTFSYEHIKLFTKESVVTRDLGNRASPVDQAHMKRPLDSDCTLGCRGLLYTIIIHLFIESLSPFSYAYSQVKMTNRAYITFTPALSNKAIH